MPTCQHCQATFETVADLPFHGAGLCTPKTMSTPTQHTPGAIRAAEAITGGKYGDETRYQTSYGKKTVKGIADLIEIETASPELLEALQAVLDSENSTLGDGGSVLGDDFRNMARAAIAKAKGIQTRLTPPFCPLCHGETESNGQGGIVCFFCGFDSRDAITKAKGQP